METKPKSQKDCYCSYYTYSDAIRDYMVQKLDLYPGLSVLEPCAGDGAFVERLIGKGLQIICIDKNPDAVVKLQSNYGREVEILHADTVLDDLDTLAGVLALKGLPTLYDRIIANPPYGAWFDYEDRRKLKKRYPGLYVRESYAVFLVRCIDLLKPGGRLTFIIPDTWMTLHLHRGLVSTILEAMLGVSMSQETMHMSQLSLIHV